MKMNNDELNTKIKSLAAQERSLTEEILRHIAEVDRRKMFLAFGFSSLFDYLVREVGYSEGSAQRRIDSARLLQRIPEISSQIREGSLNLSQISKMQTVCREVKKTSGKPVDISFQKEILSKLQNQGARSTDLILAQEFQIEIKQETKKVQRDESVRLELTFSKEEMELIESAKAILSNKTGGGLKEAILEMAAQTMKASVPKKVAATVASVKTVTPKLRKNILTRDQSCQFKDLNSGQVCGSKYFLEVDHIHPQFAGGSHVPENLRALCAAHNKFRYRQEILRSRN